MYKSRIFSVVSIIFIVLLGQIGYSQLTARPFNLAYSKNTRGGVVTIGNTVMNAVTITGVPDTTAMNETSNPNNGQGGLGYSQYGNDQSDMKQVDIDAVSSTHNSSSADLGLPAGSNTILFARLYWGARIDSAAYSQSLDTLRKIKLRKGTTGNYTQFIAQDLDTIVGTDRAGLVYQAYVDITNFVQTNGAGTYMVADVPLTELDLQGGQYGGWAITVAYENTSLPYNSIRIYDGFAQVYNAGNAGTLAITLSGLNVPATTLLAADAVMGSVAWEGDASLSGDYIKINNVTVSNTLNPSNNFFNGSISRNAVFVTAKNPNYSNQMGVDIDELNVGTGYNINSGATSVNILFGTTADMYFPGVFTFVMKSKEPTVKIIKTVSDANGNGLVDNNEVLTYTLTGNNLGPDSSYNTFVIDTIPANVTYVPGSLQVINAPGVSAGMKTDASGDDQALVSVIGGRTIVRFNIGLGSTASAGGVLPVLTGSEFVLGFKVKAPANASTVTNLGRVYGQSVNGDSFTDESTATIYLNTTLGVGQSDTACNSFTWNGTTYTQSGTYTYSYINTSGNPVTDTLYLTINYSSTGVTDVVVCAAALPYSWNGQSYSAAGMYTANLTTVAGCDSTDMLHLTVNQASFSSTTERICPSQLPYSWNGQSYAAPGSYSVTLVNAAGCDSVAVLVLILRQPTESNTDENVCSNALPYSWNGQSYNAAGTYSVILQNAAGCDSIARLTLAVLQTTTSLTPVSVCSNALPYSWNGQSYNVSGTYSDTLTNAAGCDSIAVLDLTVNAVTFSMTHVEVCPGNFPYVWNGQSYNAAGTYMVTLTNAAGCDSMATLMIMLLPVSSSNTPVSVCSSALPYSWNGQSYNAAGTYSVLLTNMYGCDSTATLELEVRQPTSSMTHVEVCPGNFPYVWNGQSYNDAGTYMVTLTNAAGCDSMATLMIMLLPASSSNTPVSVCSSALPYSWNGQSYNAAGTYSVLLTNMYGCDSTATLELEVRQPTSGMTNEIICSNALPYSWNGQNYASAGTYSVTLVNAAGCDSVATLDLTVLQPTTSQTNMTVCSNALPYSWNGQSYNAAGTYSLTLVNAQGCDSIAVLTLDVNPVIYTIIDTVICERDLPFVWNGNSYVQTTNISLTFTGSSGCDSMATLMLTVINCDPPCYTENFDNNPAGWTLSQGARFFNYNNPASNCAADKGIITPGVGGNNPAFIRTPVYTSSGASKLRISFDIYVFDANLKCATWKNYDCPTSIDVFYVKGGVRYPGIIDFVLPPNGPTNSPFVTVEFSVGNALPAGAAYSVEIAFKFWSGTGVCVQQNTKYVIDNFSVCEKQCAACPSSAVYSRALLSASSDGASEANIRALPNRVSAWPVPTSGTLHLSYPGLQVIQIDVLDLSGRNMMSVRSGNPESVDISRLNPGYYLLRVVTDSGIQTRRVQLVK